ncbi:MAG: type II toxin-antitoxin system VapC family toxin [Candidatus Devosia phytovorans]|uniref:Type II toxin-antitoxin system VapC family toxin n=1 Tax=Candidatus Devosia phytovorans TaxID=3121372 RepID=A0AAJ5VV42_9HYPH|nr:type II toxin-antitoxin system VapC family toxin [Devosia sp.]WEK04902.1 MAG: type II toxin-antitoxin system VapC family toxin [Devosia sp.]
MLGVDTNLLVRFITRDDEAQATLAHEIITRDSNQPIRVTLIVLIELVWVLRKVKRWPSHDVFEVCRRLLQSNDFSVEQSPLIEQAIAEAVEAECDLADALISLMNAKAGCVTTVTFDQDAQKLAGMTPAETYL